MLLIDKPKEEKKAPVRCSCGEPILGIPADHIFQDSDDEFAGTYWNCAGVACKTTHFIPYKKPEVKAA
jgi:hypothetical protein